MSGLPPPVDVHVSVVSHANRALVRRCLRSLPAACGSLTWRITVVENLPPDGPPLAEEFPWADVVTNAAPAGFAHNHNAVLTPVVREKQARHLLVLNDDTELAPESVTALVGHADRNAALGAVGPVLVSPEGRRQHSLHAFPTAWTSARAAVRPRTPFCRPLPSGVGWLSGACLLVRAEAVGDAPLFDTRFYMFFEDTDLCRRLWSRAWQVTVCEEAVVVHLDHQTVSRIELRGPMHRQMQRSMYLYLDKHLGRRTAGAVALVWQGALALRWLWSVGVARATLDADERAMGGELRRLAVYRPWRPLPHERMATLPPVEGTGAVVSGGGR